jgi:hypothetical protein
MWKAVDKEAKQADEHRKSITRKIDSLKKNIMEFFSEPITLLEQARDKVIGPKIKAWKDERDRIAAEQEAKLLKEKEERQRELARQEAVQRENERLAIEKEQAAIAAGNAAAAAKARAEADRAAAEAEKRNQAAQVAAAAPTTVAPAIPQVKGLTDRETWKFRVVNFTLVPDAYKIPNETMLGQHARSTKGKVPIPGIEFFPESKIGGSR